MLLKSKDEPDRLKNQTNFKWIGEHSFIKFCRENSIFGFNMDNIILYTKLSSLPDNLKSEVEDFIDFLASKRNQKQKKTKPKFGSGKGMFLIKSDFDEPLEDFKDYMF